MCHVLSEGSKWSGWVRPCGLPPCAPRYYYNTPRCTLVYSLVLSSVCCASVWCCAPVPLSCGVPCALPALPVVWLRGAVAVVCGCGASCPCSPCPCGCMLQCALYSLYFSCLFSGDNTCPIYGVLYVGLVRSLYTCPIFRLAIYDPFCTHSKSRPLDSECGFPKVGLNFRCSVFSFLRNSPR